MPPAPDIIDLPFQRHANALLVEALALPVGKRRAHVRAQSGADTRLADEVLALLDGEDGIDDFLARPAVLDLNLLPDDADDNTEPDKETPIPERIGHYVITQRLGSGGMGDVFRARQEHPVRREVALKCIRANLAPEARQRFLIEQGALARLGHSNVARFFDAGTTDDGQPYFAMELVPGEPITHYCDAHRLSVTDRLYLFLQVCAGVEHAHRQQILYRDIKPTNVLVVDESGSAIAKVIDFGIAKSLDRAVTELAQETGASILGTPVYMSPEALDPRRIDGGIDTRTDVYSLGVLLYELLSGRTPFDSDDSGLIGLIGKISCGDTPSPSQRLSKLSASDSSEQARRRDTHIGSLIKTLHGDLDWIVAKAMATERERRYGAVSELAADINRFLAHEPIAARPADIRYRLRMFARRHRTAAVAIGIALFGLLLGLAGLSYGMLKARREAGAARQALAQSREVSNFLIGLFDASRPGSEPAAQISAADLLDRGAEQLGTRLVDQPRARARFLRTIGDVYVQIGHYDEAQKILARAQSLLDAESPVDVAEQHTLQRSFGVLAFHRAQWKKAERLLRAGIQGLNPADDPATWSLAIHNLGVTEYKQHRLDEAMTQFQRALRVREKYLPNDQAQIDRSWNAIASIYLAKGEAEKAGVLFKKVLAHRRASLGDKHAYVAMSLKNLALVDEKLGHIAAAEKQLREAVAIQQSALGPGNPDLAGTLATLGDLLNDYADPASAEAPMRRALGIWRAALGNNNMVAAHAMLSLGIVLQKLGRLDQAEKLMRESLAVRQRLGQPESSLEYPRMYLGLIALDRGQLDKAQPILQHSLDLWQRTLRPGHPSLSWPMLGLARIDLARGDSGQAEQMSDQALQIRIKSFKPGNVAIADAQRIHNDAIQAAAKQADADPARRNPEK